MNQPISVFPYPLKYLVDPADPELCENPVSKEHHGQVSNGEIVAQDDVQVQIMRHTSSFFGGLTIYGRIVMS